MSEPSPKMPSRRRPAPTRTRCAPLALALVLAACGDPQVDSAQPPIAFAGYDEVHYLRPGADGQIVPYSIVLDGSRSVDPGEPTLALTYAWHQADGPLPATRLAPGARRQTLRLDEPGRYTFVLVVRSRGQRSDPDAVHVLLLASDANEPPLPVVTFSPLHPIVGQQVALSAADSTDPDPGDFILAHRWGLRRPDGATAELQGDVTSSFLAELVGEYAVSLTVADSHGLPGSVVVTVPVAACAPTGPEQCNGLDDDCDGERDEDFDLDGDHHSRCEDDCDDDDPAVHGGATETCDGADDDCDGATDEGFDLDDDGVTTCAGDCDDQDRAVLPGATEWCNGQDDDCDGQTDEGFDTDQDGVKVCDGDCDDLDAAVAPGLPERCNGRDDDCDQAVDEGFDADGNGVADCLECSPETNPELGQPCDPRGCTPGTWVCLRSAGGPGRIACEPELHLVDELTCGRFTRSGVASYVQDAAGTVALAPPDTVRRQWDARLGARALLIEGQRTNLVRRSQTLTADPWRIWPNNTEVTTVVAGVPAPDGGPAERYYFVADRQSLNQSELAPRADGALAYSLWLRSAQGLRLRVEAGGNQSVGRWDATDAWQRVSGVAEFAPGAPGNAGVVLRNVPASGEEGQGTLWGVQVERGDFSTSYIPTQAEPQTRDEDRVAYTADFVGADQGTVAFWLRPLYPEDTTEGGLRLIEVDDVLRCDYDGVQGEVACAAGGAEARVPAVGLGPQGWSFVAVSWSASGGVTVYAGAEELLETRHPGPLALSAPSGEAVHPLPLFASSRDVRLWSRALTSDELRRLFEADAARYR